MRGKKIKSVKKVSSEYEKIFEQKKQLNKINHQFNKLKENYKMLKIEEEMNGTVTQALKKLSKDELNEVKKIQKMINQELDKLAPLETKKQAKRATTRPKSKNFEFSPYMVR